MKPQRVGNITLSASLEPNPLVVLRRFAEKHGAKYLHAYSETEERVPAGSPGGGEWTTGGEGTSKESVPKQPKAKVVHVKPKEGDTFTKMYKGTKYTLVTVRLGSGSTKFMLVNHSHPGDPSKTFSSPSSAGQSLTNHAVNGWVFWNMDKGGTKTKPAFPEETDEFKKHLQEQDKALGLTPKPVETYVVNPKPDPMGYEQIKDKLKPAGDVLDKVADAVKSKTQWAADHPDWDALTPPKPAANPSTISQTVKDASAKKIADAVGFLPTVGFKPLSNSDALELHKWADTLEQKPKMSEVAKQLTIINPNSYAGIAKPVASPVPTPTPSVTPPVSKASEPAFSSIKRGKLFDKVNSFAKQIGGFEHLKLPQYSSGDAKWGNLVNLYKSIGLNETDLKNHRKNIDDWSSHSTKEFAKLAQDAVYGKKYDNPKVAAMAIEYAVTQGILKDKHGEFVTLYRGISGNYADQAWEAAKTKTTIALNTRGADSWTSKSDLGWGDTKIQNTWPIEKVVVSHISNDLMQKNHPSEHEYVVVPPGNELILEDSKITRNGKTPEDNSMSATEEKDQDKLEIIDISDSDDEFNWLHKQREKKEDDEKHQDDLSAYGTSEGVKKAWDSRGRGRAESLPDFKALTKPDLKEPPFKASAGMKTSAGVLCVEKDGRVWLVEPNHHFGGYVNTFPKGGPDKDESMQQAAVRELWEETGLLAKVTGYLGDVDRTTSTTRYYIGERVGGVPGKAGDETYAVKLVDLRDPKLDHMLNDTHGDETADHKVVSDLRDHLGIAKPEVDFLAQKVGSQAGSNPGGVYRGNDGVDRYVKFYKNPAQGRGEALANTMYRDLGLIAPKSTTFEHDGKQAFASNIISGGKTLQQTGVTEKLANKVMDGFAADVLVNNWDAVGTGKDNILTDGKNVARIDNGAAFLYRAQGAPKPNALLNTVSEYQGFFNKAVNPHYADVANAAGYKSADELGGRLKRQVEDITDLRDQSGGWEKYLDKKAPNMPADERTKIVSMLNARTAFLQRKAGIEVKAYGTSEGVKKEWDTRGRHSAGTYESNGEKHEMPSIADKTGTLSDHAHGWLNGYQYGIEGENSKDVHNPLPSDEVLKELSQFVGKNTKALYRAEYVGANVVSDAQAHSYSRYRDDAQHIVDGNDAPMHIVTHVVPAERIVVDTTRLPKAYRDEYGASLQHEVIVAKGDLADRLKSIREGKLSGAIEAYGTSEGVKKEWDERGRGRQQDITVIKSVDDISKTYTQWNAYNKGKAPNEQARWSAGVAGNIARDFDTFDKVSALHDAKGNVIAMYACSNMGTFTALDDLCVHPAILRGDIEAKGIGTRMMVDACKYALSQKGGLKLYAIDSARGFYTKCGMKNGDDDKNAFSFDRQGLKQFVEKASEAKTK